MLKKKIRYEDLDGNPIEETFYFHMSPIDIAEFEGEYGGDLADQMRRIAGTSDTKQVMPMFRDMVGRTVGRKSDDNKRFIKTPEIRDEFMQSDAYSALLIEFLKDPQSALEFMIGILPASLGKAAGPQMAATMAATATKSGLLTHDDAVAMTRQMAPGNNLTIKEVSLDPVGMPHTFAEVVTTAGEAKGVSFQGSFVDEAPTEAATSNEEVPAKSIGEFSRAQLMEMDDETFFTLAGDPRKWHKTILAIAMARRAGAKE